MFARLSAILFLILFSGTVVSAEQMGDWHRDTVKGYETYWTVNNTGSRFTIWCPPNSAISNAVIGIDIQGKRPDPKSVVKVELNRRLVKFATDKNGYIRTDCATCTDNLTYLWNLLRSSARLRVHFDDDRHAGFSLVGARDAFPAAVCEPAPKQQASR